jgi:hypothetical protein
MARFANSVLFTPTLGGTTDWTVSAAVQGYMTPAQASAADGVYKYRAESADLSQWEVGEGTYTGAGPTLTRTTILQNSSGTTSKISFSTVPNVGIVALKQDLIAIDEANVFSAAQRLQARLNISAVLKGQIFGLTLSAAGGTGTAGIAAGEAADSSGADLMVLASAMTKTTSSWAVGSGNGGMMPGALAGGLWYNGWLIKRPDTGVVDFVWDTVANGSSNIFTLASGAYTEFRRIGCMKTDGSNFWVAFSQVGDEFLWSVPTQDTTAGTPSTTANLVTLNVPTGIKVNALISGLYSHASASTVLLFTSPDQADTAPTTTVFSLIVNVASANTSYAANVRTNTSGQFRARASATSTTLWVNTFGWIDRRGRDT